MQAAIKDKVNNQPAVQFSLSNCFLTVQVIKITIPWDMMPCNLVTVYQLLRWTCCLCLQSTQVYVMLFSVLMIRATGSLKMLLFFYQTIWFKISRCYNLVTYFHENLNFTYTNYLSMKSMHLRTHIKSMHLKTHIKSMHLQTHIKNYKQI
jgi:hypothetical protein